MRTMLLAMACAMALAGCGQKDATPVGMAATAGQCAKDTDCKGERICEAGRCTNPSTPPLVAAVAAKPAGASEPAPTGPAVALLAALRLKPGTYEREGEADVAVQGYVDAGLVPAKADARVDYSDYRLLRKPATLLGHDLVGLDEEYMVEHIGCCVSEGMAVALRLRPDGEDLDAFARSNGCSLQPEADSYTLEQLFLLGLPKAPAGTYTVLQCKARDAVSDDGE